MDRKRESEGAGGINDEDKLDNGSITDIHGTPQEELHKLWRELVQKSRVHEMIKCLQAEKKKLQILQANVEPNLEYIEFAAQQQQNAKSEAVKRYSAGQEARSSKDKDTQSVGGDDESRRKSNPDSKRSASIIQSSESGVRRTWSKTGSGPMSQRGTFVATARNAAEVISNKATITDQEFEDIVELCEDKIEQKALREAYDERKAREKYLHNADERRTMLYNFINSKFFNNFMLVIIVISIVGIFLLTFENIAIRFAWPLIILDSCIIGIFLVEAIVKVTIYKEDYFKQLWNILDMLIIVVHFVEVAVDLITRTLALSTDINANIGFKFLKSLRALRLLRVIKFLPNLQVIVATVFQSMLSIGSIAVLMLLFIFVFAVMGRGLFYERLPNKFGDLWLSFVTLFQLLTLDDWFELLEEEGEEEIEVLNADEFENDEEKDTVTYWLMFGYLFAYLVIEFFVFLNLFVAVLVDNFQLTLADVEIQKQKEAMEELEAQKKFEDMKKEGVDPSITEEEHLRHLAELEQLGMKVEDYFPVDPDSKEAELLSEFFKDMNSIDFERFLWKRRLTLFNMIIDTALSSRANATTVPQDKGSDSDDDDQEEVKQPSKLPTKAKLDVIDNSVRAFGSQESATSTADGNTLLKSSVHPNQLRSSIYRAQTGNTHSLQDEQARNVRKRQSRWN